MGDVGFGILGTGQAAHQFACGLHSVDGASARAVNSRDAGRAATFAAAHGLARSYDDVDRFLRDPDIDVVYVASPAKQHADDAVRCLAAGKAVLVEKPFACTAAEASRIVDAARESGRFCMEAMWTRFIPAMRKAVDLVGSGAIGAPRMLAADFGSPLLEDAGSHRLSANGGGAWLERGIYGLSLSHLLFGPPDALVSTAHVGPTGCDLQCAATLRFGNGAVAQIGASFMSYSSNEALIAGTGGRLRVGETFVRPEVLSLKRAPRNAPARAPAPRSDVRLRDRLKSIAWLRRIKSLLPAERRIYVGYRGNGYNYEAAEVVRCLRAGLLESPLMPWSESVEIMRVSDAVRAGWR